MNNSEMERKRQEKWKKIHEANPKKSKKKYITAAFPYPNSPQHIGHARTYTTTDIHARYSRLKGYNVLFPMAFHVTGTPIIAMANRIKEKDEEVLKVFEEIYGISRANAAKLIKPEDLVMHFSKEIELGMREMGYSIDWRRKFYSFDSRFNKFIEWQFKKLNDLGLIIKGEHPVPWCSKDKNPVGAHDTKGDVDPALKEFIWAKFHLKGSDLILMTGTTRPDALLGQTNLWVNPNGNYVIVKVKDEKWVVGKAVLEKIQQQCDQNAKIIGEISAKELIGKWVKGPAVDYELYILPAEFIDENVGSGIVYSALEDPVDLYELRKLQTDEKIIAEWKLDSEVVKKLKPIPIIDVEGMGSDLGDSIGKEFGITSAEQKDKLEEAKGELNRRVFRKGIMNKSCGKYSKMSVPKCQEKIKKEIMNSNDAVMFWEIENKPVYCRCGTEVIVNLVKNQWFINYGDEKWKKKVRECINSMKLIPDKTRADYLATVDWLKEKACTRASGLGTKFPFDKTQMIEALSDSTIYMAFYTISHLLDKFKPEELDEKFFDYIFYGKGKSKNKIHKEARKSFVYWYPLDSRHSAGDLIRNHLPFFIFNHAAIFPKENWPLGIVTNGFVLMDGKKMSKSMGNILPLRDAIKKYSADVVRFSVVAGAELAQDSDFNKSVAEGTIQRLELIKKLSKEAKDGKGGRIDEWIYAKLNKRIESVETYYEEMKLREIAQELVYETIHDLQWYSKRSSKNNLKKFFKTWSILISPFMPYFAEELWFSLGEKGFAAEQKFPKPEEKIKKGLELGEELIQTVNEDIKKISNLIGKKPSKVYIYCAEDWKGKLHNLIREVKKFDLVMKESSKDPELNKNMKDVQRITKQLIKNAPSLPEIKLSQKDEIESLEDAKEFLKNNFECEIIIEKESKSKHEKSGNAFPGKPAIILE